jgi:hypothetical protein
MTATPPPPTQPQMQAYVPRIPVRRFGIEEAAANGTAKTGAAATAPPPPRYKLSVVFLDFGHTDVDDNKYNRVNNWLSGGIVHVDLHFNHNGFTCSAGANADEEVVSLFQDKEFSRRNWAFFAATLERDNYMRIYDYCVRQNTQKVPYNRDVYYWFLFCPVWKFARSEPRGHLCASLVAEALAAGNALPYAGEMDVREMHAGHLYSLLAARPDTWQRSEHVVHARLEHLKREDAAHAERIAALPEALQRRLREREQQTRR